MQYLQLLRPLEKVLDEFVKRGAVLEKNRKSWVNDGLNNPAGLAWLIDKGVSLDGRSEIAHLLAGKGDAAVPAIWALYRRGVDLQQKDSFGKTPLNIAIDHFSVELVRSLLQMGVVRNGKMAQAARLQASQLQPVDSITFCNHCPYWVVASLASNSRSPAEVEALRQNKHRIIELLKPDQRDYRSILRDRLK